ncbi:MAG: hypothetical protein ACLPR9_12985 [Acidimicrobiales bacterium]
MAGHLELPILFVVRLAGIAPGFGLPPAQSDDAEKDNGEDRSGPLGTEADGIPGNDV